MGKEDYEGMGLSEEEITALEEADEDKTEEEKAAEAEAEKKADKEEGDKAKAEKEGEEVKTKEETEEEAKKAEAKVVEDAKKEDEPDEEKIDIPLVPAKMGTLVDMEKAQARIDEIKAELDEIKTEQEKAKSKYEEGELDIDEYNTKKDEVAANRESLLREQTKIETKMEMSDEVQKASVQANWQGAQAHYLSLHPEIKGDKNLLSLFATNVNEILASEEGGKMDDYDILKSAYKKMSYLIPEDKKSEEQKAQDKKDALLKDAKKIAADKAKGALPQTLKDTSAAGDNDEAGKYAHLDGLTGEVLEKAIGKLTLDEQEEWAREA